MLYGGNITIDKSYVPARLAALGALAAMTPEATFLQGASALHAVIHVARVNGRRMVAELAVVQLNRNRLEVVPALTINPEQGPVREPGWTALMDRLGLPDTFDVVAPHGTRTNRHGGPP